MHVPRLLLLLALLLISADAAAAQAAARRDHPPASPHQLNERGLNLFAAPPGSSQVPLWRKWLHRDTAENEQCYTIRGYNFTQDKNAPDTARFKDKTTCTPAGQVKMKGAIAGAKNP